MPIKWICWWILTTCFVLSESWGFWWATRPNQLGQAMPAFLLPFIAGVLGFGILVILALIFKFV